MVPGSASTTPLVITGPARGAGRCCRLPSNRARATTLQRRFDRYLVRAQGAYSDRTIEALRGDFRIFSAWCVVARKRALPASPNTLIAFIRHQTLLRMPSTIRRELASIGHVHRALSFADPTRNPRVGLELRRVQRLRTVRPRRRLPLRRAEVDAILLTLGGSLRDLRDRALLLVARDTLCRRSELAALKVSDVRWRGANGSAAILIRRGKSDPLGHGRVAWISPEARHALRRWLSAAGIVSGSLFRSVDGLRAISSGLRPQGIGRRVKVMAAKLSLDVRRVGAHSTRLGMCLDLVAAGHSLVAVQLAGGWRSPTMPARYAAEFTPEEGAVALLYSQEQGLDTATDGAARNRSERSSRAKDHTSIGRNIRTRRDGSTAARARPIFVPPL